MFFSHAKNDSRSGRTVKKLQLIKKSMGFTMFLMFLGGGHCDSWPAGSAGLFTVCVCFVYLLFDAPWEPQEVAEHLTRVESFVGGTQKENLQRIPGWVPRTREGNPQRKVVRRQAQAKACRSAPNQKLGRGRPKQRKIQGG